MGLPSGLAICQTSGSTLHVPQGVPEQAGRSVPELAEAVWATTVPGAREEAVRAAAAMQR